MQLMSFVLVEERGKYLLIQEVSAKNKGKWYLPGGKVEKEESPAMAAQREAKEESGCRVKVKGIFCLRYHHKSLVKEKLHIYYSGKTVSRRLKIKADKNSLGAGWFTYNEIRSLPLRDNLLELLALYKKSKKKLLPARNFIFPLS
jgi:ADP-ribose pyrophosphatase YjhB (NUDIX family)